MRVVVVGAGPAGLVACKTLLENTDAQYPFDPVVLEQEADIGGTFRYRTYEVICLSRAAYSSTATDALPSRTEVLCLRSS